MKSKNHSGLCFLLLALLLAAVFFVSFLIGRYPVSAGQTLRLLLDRFVRGISFGR